VETAPPTPAELIQLRWGGSGQPLTATTGRIHHGQLPGDRGGGDLLGERTA
jgi:xanthine dehydrogenase accessory factor